MHNIYIIIGVYLLYPSIEYERIMVYNITIPNTIDHKGDIKMTKSNTIVVPTSVNNQTYLQTIYLSDRNQMRTEFQCTTLPEVESLIAATLSASLYDFSPLKLFLMTTRTIYRCIKDKLYRFFFDY